MDKQLYDELVKPITDMSNYLVTNKSVSNNYPLDLKPIGVSVTDFIKWQINKIAVNSNYTELDVLA